MDLNPVFKKRIFVQDFPVSDKSDIEVYYMDNGPASKVSFENFKNKSGQTKTLSIDDFVERNKVSKVNFIKMDIEGAESYALKGAVNTIKKFKPKLAIAIYHSMDDF